jgi:hypothetical protein
MTTTTDQMKKNAEKFRKRLEEIRGDWTMSDEAKRLDIQAAYEDARSTHVRLEDEFRAALKGRVEETRKAAFAAPKVGKEAALDTFLYRDALERAKRLKDSRELSGMLEQASTTGDAPLAKAVLYRAYELQDARLVGAYHDARPDELPKWDAFMDAAKELNTLEELGITMAAGVPSPERPPEVSHRVSGAAQRSQFAYTEGGEPRGE